MTVALFNDWGGTPAFEDIDDAQDQLVAWMGSTGWPASAAQVVIDGGLSVKEDLEGLFGIDLGSAADYWENVAQNAGTWITASGYNTNDLTNWDKWQGVFNSSAETAASYESGRELGELPTVIADAGAATMAELEELNPVKEGTTARAVLMGALYGGAGGATFGAARGFLGKRAIDLDAILRGAQWGALVGGAWQFYQATADTEAEA
jgi:hypothetical protein